MSKKPVTGTKEWASVSVNCMTGCEHDCNYCYAKAMAIRFEQATEKTWKIPRVREKEVKKGRRKTSGRIMFPTTHDITPKFLDPCLSVLKKMLAAGNEVLIVSKPHRECIERLCYELAEYKDQIMFRFSIGAMDNEILKYWEPGAPSFEERLYCLAHACETGFETSVSCEPLLDAFNVEDLVDELSPYVTHSIWIGKMNRIPERCSKADPERVATIREGQLDSSIWSIYEALKDNPLIRWKESYKAVLGITLETEKGTDR